MNQVSLIGRLTRDPELRRTQNGNPVVSFALAVDNRHKEDGADFIACVAWNRTAELIHQYVKKGHRLAINGRLATRTYESKGVKHYVTEVIVADIDFLERKEAEKESFSKPDFSKLEPLDGEDGVLPF